ncbi:hypothetical protein NRS6085_09770 [Bacillus subtilis]|nr:hypothetical protein NRS6085_00929 [Bacillus subtilis]CAI6266012.1 hypothetical protein NRS6085_09770 [Bacillus subtilis]
MEMFIRKISEKITKSNDDVIGQTYINSIKKETEDQVYAP